MPQIAILRTDPSCPPACDGWKVVTEWSELGSRDIDGKAGRPSKRARTSQYDSAGNLHARNIYGPGPDEILMRGDWTYGWFFYHADKQGSITALVAGDGSVVEKYTYDAFGRPTILSANNTQLSTSAVGNRFMFTGREWLADLQLYDYRHRLYNPDNGRFLQSDPTGFDAGDMNLFRYCGDDPVDGSDPMGLEGEYFPPGQLEAARHEARRQIMVEFSNPHRPYTLTHMKLPGYPAGKIVKYYGGIQVPVLRAEGRKGYEIGPLSHGRLTQDVNGKWYDSEGDPKLQPRMVSPNHTHNNTHGERAGVGRAEWSEPDKAQKMVERMDEARPGWWHRRAVGKDGRVQNSTFYDDGSQGKPGRDGGDQGGSASRSQSSDPSAAEVDAAHTATGVPSLGAEAGNFVRASRQ